MIKIEKTETYGWEAAIRGVRNPMNSWDQSDTKDGCTRSLPPEKCIGDCGPWCTGFGVKVGPNDLTLMKKLVTAGTDHSKFMRMITVTADVTAPLYWWKEYDTYKVGTIANSCSTMHKIHEKEFTLDDFSHEHLTGDTSTAGSEIVDNHGDSTGLWVTPISLLKVTVDCLNNYRLRFLQTDDKNWWWQMIQLLPSSYNQKRTISLNYAARKRYIVTKITFKIRL